MKETKAGQEVLLDEIKKLHPDVKCELVNEFLVFEDQDIEEIDLNGVDLRYIEFTNCTINKCNFISCTMNSVLFTNCYIKSTSFSNSTFVDYNKFDMSYGQDIKFNNIIITNQLDFVGVDIDYCDFRGITFDGGWINANFASIRNANFSGVNELNGTFRFTTFRYGNFRGAILTNFDHYVDVEMSNCDFTNAKLYGIRHRAVSDFSDSTMAMCTLAHVNVEKVDFRRVNLDDATIENSSFDKCVFVNSSMKRIKMSGVSFSNCDTDFINAEQSNIADIRFDDKMNLQYANMVGSKMSNVSFGYMPLQNADIRNSVLTNITYRDVWFDIGVLNTDGVSIDGHSLDNITDGDLSTGFAAFLKRSVKPIYVDVRKEIPTEC
jgi:uncharacterized protein YjbI with pentapeptide repeats